MTRSTVWPKASVAALLLLAACGNDEGPPAVATISISPAQVSLVVGGIQQLTAETRDARGVLLTGRSVRWTSSNSSVAPVTTAGVVSGVTTGTARIRAESEGKSVEVPVQVTVPPPVVITQITPATLVEGQAATITGSGFSPTFAQNTVLIDDLSATITQASATSLQITVPFGCKLRRTVPVRVSVGGIESNTLQFEVRPAAYLSLAVNQMAILSSPADRCLHFDASSTAERYVFGIQSVSDVVSTLTAVRVTASIAGSAIPTPMLPAVANVDAPLAGSPPVLTAGDMLWQQHIALTAAAYEREIAILQQLGPAAPDRVAAAAVPSIPATIAEGDTIVIKFPDFNGNTCTQSFDISVRASKITARAIFLEDVANPEPLATTALDDAGTAFATVYATDVDYFGEPGDLDQNQRVAIVISREVNRITPSAPLGFVSHSNIFSTAQCLASNEGEYFFLRAPDPTGQFNAGVYTAATLAQHFPYLLAHEFAHIIQSTRRRAAGGSFMTSWLAEALAVSAQEAAGFQFLGLQQGSNYGPRTVYSTWGADPRNFFNYMSDLIAYFGYDFNGNKVLATPEECSWVGNTSTGGNPGPCRNATRLLYGVPWSLIKYTIDRHLGGAANQKQYQRAFSNYVGSVGFAELQAVLGRPIREMLAQWAAMLYIDDRYPGATAFQLANWNLREIASAWQSPNSDLAPRLRAFANFTDEFAVRGASSAYFEISGTGRPATAIRFRSPSGGLLPGIMQVWVVRVQ